MIFTIHDGTLKDILPGDKIVCQASVMPDSADNGQLILVQGVITGLLQVVLVPDGSLNPITTDLSPDAVIEVWKKQ